MNQCKELSAIARLVDRFVVWLGAIARLLIIALVRKLRTQMIVQIPILGELPDSPSPHQMWLRL